MNSAADFSRSALRVRGSSLPWPEPELVGLDEADKMEEVHREEKNLSETGRAIISLAQQHGVSYTPTTNDSWARDVTRLADDDVVLDDIELLLIALQRTGHLSRPEALRLQVDYLREARL